MTGSGKLKRVAGSKILKRHVTVLQCQRCQLIPALIDYLTLFYQTNDMAQMEVIARSMLAAIPDDIVALQFLGLALYQMGRIDDAYRAFKRVAARPNRQDEWENVSKVCEPAGVATFRAATRAHSGLADGWYQIALVLKRFGFYNSATRAFKAARVSRGVISKDIKPVVMR